MFAVPNGILLKHMPDVRVAARLSLIHNAYEAEEDADK